jgi:hypothetical protein
MKEYPQGLRPWARKIPLWLLPTIGRVLVIVALPLYFEWRAWVHDLRRPF